MSVSTPTKPATTTADESASGFVDLSESDLDALIERIEQARDHNLALSSDDYALILNVVLTLASMHERLSHNDLTIIKLKKLLGIIRSSEKLRDLVPPKQGDDNDANKDDAAERDAPEKKTKPSGRNTKGGRSKPSRRKSPPSKPTVHKHALEELNKGDVCPECHAGKVYKYDPAVLLRIVGHAPLSSERHICEQVKCSGCGEVFTAPQPDHVKADGRPNQQFGYSARAILAIMKYFAANPFYRQETTHDLFGGHVASSTIFDQCEHVGNALNPVFKAMKRMAADAPLFYLDDTTNRILMQQPVKKIRHGKERLRTGIYTSACLVITEDKRRLVLLQTNVGHAGEWMEEILRARDPNKDPPLIMSDALSANRVLGTDTNVASCNAHGRRGFADLSEQHLDEVIYALELYQHVWINDSHCREHDLCDNDRLAYHKEHSLPHMNTLLQWCQQQLESDAVEPNSNLGQAMKYFIRHFEPLTAFCRLPGAPLDNNECERIIKVVVRARKNSLFFKTAVGAEISDVITSILVVCHEHGIDALSYLIAVQKNQLAVKASPEKWMPWNYPQA